MEVGFVKPSDRFWTLIESVQWGSQNPPLVDDLKKDLMERMYREEADPLRDFFLQKVHRLSDKLQNAPSCLIDGVVFWKEDWDGFYDLVYHCIALGKKAYTDFLLYPQSAINLYQQGDVLESFIFVLPECQEWQYFERTYYENKAKELLKKFPTHEKTEKDLIILFLQSVDSLINNFSHFQFKDLKDSFYLGGCGKDKNVYPVLELAHTLSVFNRSIK